MVLVSLSEMTRWGNLYSRLSGVLGPSSSYGGGLRALFYSAVEVAGMADPMRPRVCPAPIFQRLVPCDVPVSSRFLGRPQLLTRHFSLPLGRDPMCSPITVE